MHISSEHLGNLHKYKYSVIDVRYALTSLPGTTRRRRRRKRIQALIAWWWWSWCGRVVR
jgi:hypothetical protein